MKQSHPNESGAADYEIVPWRTAPERLRTSKKKPVTLLDLITAAAGGSG